MTSLIVEEKVTSYEVFIYLTYHFPYFGAHREYPPLLYHLGIEGHLKLHLQSR